MAPDVAGIFHIWCASTRSVLCEISEPTIILRDDWASRVQPESICPECSAKWRMPGRGVTERRVRERVQPTLVPAQAR